MSISLNHSKGKMKKSNGRLDMSQEGGNEWKAKTSHRLQRKNRIDMCPDQGSETKEKPKNQENCQQARAIMTVTLNSP